MIRGIMFDFRGSRMAWAQQVYSTTGMMAYMSEGEPQYVAWRAYADACQYDGMRKWMTVARIWRLSMGDDETLTPVSEELKVMM